MPSALFIASKADQLKRYAGVLSSAGIEVRTASCVLSGLELVGQSQPDVIICDDSASGLNALDLLEIRGDEPSLTDTSVVVISESNERKLSCYRAGCDDYIELPIDPDELIWRIRVVLRRTSSKGVGGSFSHINIFDFIQMLVSGRAEGRLDVDCGDLYGTLYFEEGMIFHASTLDLEGEEAFLALLRETQKGGEFHFSSEKRNPDISTNIEARTDHLLLGLANRLDEE